MGRSDELKAEKTVSCHCSNRNMDEGAYEIGGIWTPSIQIAMSEILLVFMGGMFHPGDMQVNEGEVAVCLF